MERIGKIADDKRSSRIESKKKRDPGQSETERK